MHCGLFKGQLCHFKQKSDTQTGNIYNIGKIIIQTQKYLFFP